MFLAVLWTFSSGRLLVWVPLMTGLRVPFMTGLRGSRTERSVKSRKKRGESLQRNCGALFFIAWSLKRGHSLYTIHDSV